MFLMIENVLELLIIVFDYSKTFKIGLKHLKWVTDVLNVFNI